MTSPTPPGAVVAAGVTVVLWASAFVSIRVAGEFYSPGALALGRLVSGAVVLVALLAVTRSGWPPRAAWPGIAGAGLLWFGVYMVALNWGEREVDAGTAALLVNIGPVVIALLGVAWLGERLTGWLVAGGLVAFAGAVVVGVTTAGPGHVTWTGVMLCLVAAVSYAVGVVAQKPALAHASPLQVSGWGCVVGALACLPFAPTLVAEVAAAPWWASANVLYLGVFPTAVAFTTWGYALSYMSASRLGAVTYLVPALVVVVSWAVLGEVPAVGALAGGVLCLVGVALSRRGPVGGPSRPGVAVRG
ncbi:DMT family transporter [Nocardiopsis flavescens]|uniref:Threonine/homoserine efflux transporter RhtA n=1 Tax=Nocardiopsis flavescens TaxID=758803 RepID=A0A1M6AK64_9ACTN|nr:DMT family transporter [Nocardiopsis flavescens]SHI36904.1 Threonine/homoserine efflux transporter RhtA [Nocardiopsis flavescens]